MHTVETKISLQEKGKRNKKEEFDKYYLKFLSFAKDFLPGT